MPPFAVAQAREGQFTAPDPGAWDVSPQTLLGSVQSAWEDQLRTRNTNVRSQQYRDALWTRHRAIEKAAGQKLGASDSMVDLVRGERMPGVLPDAEYEARIDALRAKNPQAFAGIDGRGDVQRKLDAQLNAVRAKAVRGSQEHPIASFVGAAGGVLADPFNLAGALVTGPLGAGRPLAARVLMQSAANAGLEAATIPARMSDATVAGPKYTFGEAAADVAGAAVFGGVFELGAAGAGAALRRLRGAQGTPPEARYSIDQLDRALVDDQALGPIDGLAHEEGLDALVKGRPMPVQEPAQELGDLFGESPAPTATPAAGITGRAEYRGRTILQGSFDPAELETDAVRFQYKEGADAQGVTARLRGVDAWDPTSSGKVIVFEDASGARFVADGHQRRALALRMEGQGWDARLDGYLFREADGWTARQVRTVAALKNIREGSGTILDAAKIFRDAPEAIADRSLPITGDFISQARALARLNPEAFGAVVNKVIPERYGAEIGAMTGNRPDLHAGLVKLMKQADPGNIEEARALVSEAMLDDWVKAEGEQADFFGDLPAESTTIARAKVKAAVAAALRKDARIYAQLVKHADAIEAGGNVLLRDGNEAAAAVNRTALEVLSRLALRQGEVGEAMAAAAREVLAGKRPGDVAKGIVAMVRNRLAGGEALEGLRLTTLDPPPPTPAALAVLDKADDPKTWEAAAFEAPEDAALSPAGLFDDLEDVGAEEIAHAALVQCAPAKPEAAE